jgi:hypothetical protein
MPAMMQKVAGKLPARPYFRGYMVHSPGEGWVWYLSTLSGRESIARIRAADGRQWPYTGAAAATPSFPFATPRPAGRAPKGYSR